MSKIDALITYEIIAKLYEIRYSQMAPGKSVPPMGRQADHLSHSDNSERFQRYLRSEDERSDMLSYIYRLEEKIDQLENGDCRSIGS